MPSIIKLRIGRTGDTFNILPKPARMIASLVADIVGQHAAELRVSDDSSPRNDWFLPEILPQQRGETPVLELHLICWPDLPIDDQADLAFHERCANTLCAALQTDSRAMELLELIRLRVILRFGNHAYVFVIDYGESVEAGPVAMGPVDATSS